MPASPHFTAEQIAMAKLYAAATHPTTSIPSSVRLSIFQMI